MKKEHHITGIVLLDKPTGFSSNAALQKVKRLYNAKKAGHTGSLDPIATGMLPICLGEATKFSQFLLESDKAYHVTVRLGERTATGDREGEVIEKISSQHVTASSLQEAMRQLTGEMMQTPPMFSALKYKGQPLYALARKGIEVERAARQTTIYEFTLIDFSTEQFTCFVKCSKGTYVRTLIEDCAKQLNTAAFVMELRRVYVTPYETSSMMTLPDLERLKIQHGEPGLQSFLLPITTMMRHYPVVTLDAASAFYFRMGQAIRFSSSIVGNRAQIMTEQGEFLGVAGVTVDGRLQPERLLSQSPSLEDNKL